MSEQQLMDWFAAHPFTRSLCLLAFGALAAGVRADWAKWQQHRMKDPTVEFSLWIAARSYFYAMVTAVAPAFAAQVFKILGGMPSAVVAFMHTTGARLFGG